MRQIAARVLTLIACVGLAGCSAFRQSISDEDPVTSEPLSPAYDQRDLLSWSDLISEDLMSHPFPAPDEDKPIVVVMGIENRTRTHADGGSSSGSR